MGKIQRAAGQVPGHRGVTHDAEISRQIQREGVDRSGEGGVHWIARKDDVRNGAGRGVEEIVAHAAGAGGIGESLGEAGI
jgi:hypothetical protein